MAHTVTAGRHRETYTEVRSPLETVVARIIQFIFGVIIAFLAMRFILLLLGANTGAPFVSFVYNVSDVFMAPFATVFGTPQVNGAVFEWSALVAIAVYALVSWGLVALIAAASPRDYAQTVSTSEADDAVAERYPSDTTHVHDDVQDNVDDMHHEPHDH